MVNVTLVTALFDIGREKKADGRKFQEYLTWLEGTLSIMANFVIYTTAELKDFVNKCRIKPHERGFQTHHIISTLEDFRLARFLPDIRQSLQNESYKKKVCDPNRIECKIPEYLLVIWSKFEMVEHAIRSNPFGSDMFFWIDAGSSRFFKTSDWKIKDFSPRLDLLPPDRVLVQGTERTFTLNWSKNGFYENKSTLSATMFGGTREVLFWLCEQATLVFGEMLNVGVLNNEQIGLGILMHRYTDKFAVFTDDERDKIVCKMFIQMQDARSIESHLEQRPERYARNDKIV